MTLACVVMYVCNDGEDVARDLGMSSDFFILKHDSAPAHRAKVTIALLRRETFSLSTLAHFRPIGNSLDGD